MLFSLSVDQLAGLVDTMPGVKAFHDIPMPEGRGSLREGVPRDRRFRWARNFRGAWALPSSAEPSLERRLEVSQRLGLGQSQRARGLGVSVGRSGHRGIGRAALATKVPNLPRVSTMPAVSSSRYARATVFTARPSFPASSRTVGSRVPGGNRPSLTPSMTGFLN